jgi:NAD(P) transhydrogenase subunit alpha
MAGESASIMDVDFQAAGAQMVDASAVYAQAEIVLKVRAPSEDELAKFSAGQVLIGLLSPHQSEGVMGYAKQGIAAFAMEKLPRTTRAQTMDVLSSQANIAGYKAVIAAAYHHKRFFPMLMVAVRSPHVVIPGVGVAACKDDCEATALHRG